MDHNNSCQTSQDAGKSYDNESVITFDTLYTNNHIQILKVLLPYFDANSQKHLAILIKFMELRYTMEYLNRHMATLNAASDLESAENKKRPALDIITVFEQIKNFCTPSERAMFEQLANMKRSMEMYEEMMNMMQLFNQLHPEGESSDAKASGDSMGQSASSAGSSNPMDLLKGMLSPEQQAMFDLFSSSMNPSDE